MQSDKAIQENQIREKYSLIRDYLDERSRRIWAATEIRQISKGGKTIVKKATGLSYKTLNKGLEELQQNEVERLTLQRIRNSGGGRKKT